VKLMTDKTTTRVSHLLVLLGVIAALCISRNVGLELLPLPTSEPVATYNQPQVDSKPTSNSPSSASFTSTRIKMTAPRASSAATQKHWSNHGAIAPSTYEVPDTDSLTFRGGLPHSFYDLAFASHIGGRSPPRLA